ncbi:MAG: formate--tetrahydrofolate ligase, partial [Chloroflexi bacterium]|nr:formate--tetrahydrofolate ligase [Chloroflexota bacterium]
MARATTGKFDILSLDPTKLADWQVAEEAEKHMKTIHVLAEEWGIERHELIPMGHHVGKIDYASVLKRLQDKSNGKYINVTAITPTPLGEGKTTTTMGLVQGLGKRGKNVSGAIRQPSGGPTMNIKGSAAGGGLSQCIPLTPFSLGLTGDIDAVMNAHNLAMVALQARMQHEAINDDVFLDKKGLKRLNIDPRNVEMKWVIDFCAQSLRNIVIGMGGRLDGFVMQSGFAIAVSSEVMAILAVFKDLKDLRERMGRIVVAYNRKGEPVTTKDLEVDGAMTAWLLRAINPNLLQTVEGQPVLVHAGPFANIAVGQSSIVADQIALKLSDYHVTESGFAADIGFEKFWNIKCRFSGLKPHASVIVATIRALKMHGGGPKVEPGRP